MKKICFLILCLIALLKSASAQTSKAESTGFWTTGSSWVGGTMPGTLSAGTITALTKVITIDGMIKSKENITLNVSSLTIKAGDTLVILGNLSLVAASTLTNNGVLVVMGNMTNAASAVVDNASGKMVVTGNYTNAIGLANTFTGPSYVYGSATGFLFGSGTGNEAALTATDPTLHTFVGMIYGALPVELTSFTAIVENSNTVLSWETASEINNDHFVVERSSDGKNFDVATIVQGTGNSKTATKYNFTDDHQTVGLSYYRLSQVDFDGTKTQFDIVSVYNETATVKIYPNPAIDYLAFNIGNDHYTVSISDVKGMPCHSEINRVLEIAPGTFGVQVSALETGVYYLQLANQEYNQTINFRFVKK